MIIKTEEIDQLRIRYIFDSNESMWQYLESMDRDKYKLESIKPLELIVKKK